jgi:hypothetical protein
MNPVERHFERITRRHFLGQFGTSVGAIALSNMLGETASANPALDALYAAPKAKRIIYLHMVGSPPQQDMFDYKPALNKWNGQPCPDEMFKKERFAFIKGHPKILASPHKFAQHGQDGAWVSDLLPQFSTIVDDVSIIKSMYTDQFNHAPAQLMLYTGSPRLGRPSMGSWMSYGLGRENENLPAFVVLVSGGQTPSAGKSAWGSGFLPTLHQGVQCRTSGDPVLYVNDPPGMSREGRRRSLDAIRDLNELHYAAEMDPETLSRIEQYEMAYKMQVSVPEVMDIGNEPQSVLDMYGATPGGSGFANNCLLARRLVEQGVRYVQLFDWGWDMHGTGPSNDLLTQLPAKCKEVDRPMVALVNDLKQRGLLDDTIVVFSGEFGRTAMNEERDGSTFLGRDHHPGCFTLWAAGGGFKRGAVIGSTDELGYAVAENPIHVHDFQATILHQLGIDHTKLTYRFQGRDFRLTDVHGRVANEILA